MKNGFTLAEVLITLGITGVVAALTIPNLITNYKKKQTITQLKATYSIIAQGIQNSINDNGSLSTWDYNMGNEEFAKTYIFPYLKEAKGYQSGNWKVLSIKPSSTGCYDWGWGTRYNLANGSTISTKRISSGTYIWVDLNNKKGPNVLGSDVFVFMLNYRDWKNGGKWVYGLIPEGHWLTRDELLNKKDGYACSKELGSDWYGGEYCAAVIIKDGWQIKDDYPWRNR